VDCAGAQVRWEAPALLCQDASTARAELPERPLADDDVVVSPVDRDHRLVWIQTGRFASGDAFGPVALVEVGGRSVKVEALGTLRANPRRAKLRLEQAAGALVLVAEGERCTSADPASCERSARLMALAGARFQPSRIVSPTGSCTAAGFVHLAREEVERLGGGRERRYRLDASLAPAKDGLRLTELVTVHDRDTKQAEAQERLVRRPGDHAAPGAGGGPRQRQRDAVGADAEPPGLAAPARAPRRGSAHRPGSRSRAHRSRSRARARRSEDHASGRKGSVCSANQA
jgi:hypothetical protein